MRGKEPCVHGSCRSVVRGEELNTDQDPSASVTDLTLGCVFAMPLTPSCKHRPHLSRKSLLFLRVLCGNLGQFGQHCRLVAVSVIFGGLQRSASLTRASASRWCPLAYLTLTPVFHKDHYPGLKVCAPETHGSLVPNILDELH